ncbi:LiaF-related protein [Lactobacillus amylovorus]|uniref:LiaF transmembrane domain-containing protein n=1 Tax=Lactobacillus amylovorus TaxID=1604 RepID=UPI0023310310|nr:LiaF domain-containing protein [Lactobacillus amylovorus]MDB6243155.1 LiaF-related protein [Lactobacillus amylovorus]MDB6244599.1 LiaF-related protein [Lactobacillus amylovorus]MDB6252222.1 LiaF-related protein [Lactobacillus amylovorus]MDB6253234.1 LiaF-related protein [Lactobacillus amylovorus]MDB6268063.1 LiaF-related protein [Lactobacillus amylovorus]
MKAKWSRIFWGVGLIAAAVFLVIDQLHLLPFTIGFWAIFWTVVFVASLITSVINKNLYGTIFSIAFLVIVYAKPLHISALSPWTILLVAILVSAGISLIFRNSFKPTIIINGKKVNANWSDLINKNFKADNVITDNSFGVDSDNVVISGKMTEASRYIHSQNLKTVTIDSSMGDVSVYLDDAKAAGDEVIMNINTSMCDVDVYIPSDWQVENNMQNSLSDVDIDHSKGTGTKLILQGRNTMGDLTVKHVKD